MKSIGKILALPALAWMLAGFTNGAVAQNLILKDVATLDRKAVSNLKDVTFDGTRLTITGQDPGVLFKTHKLNLSGASVDALTFDFACEGPQANMPVSIEIYWQGDGSTAADENRDIWRLTAETGTVVAPLSRAESFRRLKKLERIRVDVAAVKTGDPVPCTAFKLDNVRLQKIELPTQPDNIKNAQEVVPLSKDRLIDIVSLHPGNSGAYRVTGENVNLQYRIDDLNLTPANADQVAFFFFCEAGTADPEFELYWSGDDMTTTTEDAVIRFNGTKEGGWMAIDLRGVPTWQKINKLKTIRLDIADPQPCKSVWISDITLRKQS